MSVFNFRKLKKWFGLGSNGNKKKGLKNNEEKEKVIKSLLSQLIIKSGLDLSFEIQKRGENFFIEIGGKDQSFLLHKDGKLLWAIQFFVKKFLQNQGNSFKAQVFMDCENFKKKSEERLIELVKKLKTVVIKRGTPVYLKALPPRDRKLVHQLISEDERVRSNSVGEGVYKKIRIFPTTSAQTKEKVKRDKSEAKELRGENFF